MSAVSEACRAEIRLALSWAPFVRSAVFRPSAWVSAACRWSRTWPISLTSFDSTGLLQFLASVVASDSSSLLVAPLDSRLSTECASFCAAAWLMVVVGVTVGDAVVGVTVGVDVAGELGGVDGGVVAVAGWVEGGGVAWFCFELWLSTTAAAAPPPRTITAAAAAAAMTHRGRRRPVLDGGGGGQFPPP